MVLAQHFQDLMKSLDKNANFNLPPCKENAFTIEFSNAHVSIITNNLNNDSV